MFLSGQTFYRGEQLAEALREHGFEKNNAIYLDLVQHIISAEPLGYDEKRVTMEDLGEEIFSEHLSAEGYAYEPSVRGIICEEMLDDGIVTYETL